MCFSELKNTKKNRLGIYSRDWRPNKVFKVGKKFGTLVGNWGKNWGHCEQVGQRSVKGLIRSDCLISSYMAGKFIANQEG